VVSAKLGTAGGFSERLACLGYADQAHLSQARVRFCRSAP
jgi:hypothetical protein